MSGLAARSVVPDAPNRWWPAAGVALGAVVMTAGTFAPWLASGTSTRNLYRSAGLVQRLAGLGRPVGLVLDALPFTGLYCIVAGVAYVLGRRHIAAGAIALLAFGFAGIALAALTNRRAGQIQLLVAGPSVTLIGALVCLATLLILGIRRQYDVRRRNCSTHYWPLIVATPSTPTAITPTATTSTATNPSPGRPRTMELR